METLTALLSSNPFIPVSAFLGLVSLIAMIGWLRASLALDASGRHRYRRTASPVYPRPPDAVPPAASGLALAGEETGERGSDGSSC